MACVQITLLLGTPGVPLWQRNDDARIIHDDEALQRVRAYIVANPSRQRKRQSVPVPPW